MNILVLNSGSSSLKYQFINIQTGEVIAKGMCERIGVNGGEQAEMSYKANGKKIEKQITMPTHKEAIELVLSTLKGDEAGVIASDDEIGAIGHRVVHGGEYFDSSVIVNDEILDKIKELSALAPLHNPANILGIEICQKIMPSKKNIAVFDTAFHQTVPDFAYMYGLPYADYEELRVRKYGFHGTSHKFVSEKAVGLLNKDNSKVIVCHLGNGSSVSAVKDGKCVETSMGLTPLQGLMMGTRCGDLDPAAVLYIMEKRGLTAKEMDTHMNKKSGIVGIFEKTSDFRDVRDAYFDGDERATLTVNMLTYRIKSYIASYAAALGGVDAICFTGGIGENAELVREKSVEGLEYMGVELDNDRNMNFRELEDQEGNVDISKEGTKTRIYVIPTNEEYVIAKDTYELAK